jgi:FixJ family two-component response regulator
VHSIANIRREALTGGACGTEIGIVMSDIATKGADREEDEMSSWTHSTPTQSAGESKLSVVYVVDDDQSIRRALSSLLRSVGLRVETFESSQQFLAFPKYDAPSCLILDVRLRGESGLAFQEEVAKIGLRMPILFMTGYGDIEMSVKAMKAGALDFFPKPFRDQDMLDAVAHALTRDGERLAAEQSVAALRSSYDSLTPREREVMGFVVAGLMNKQIAAEMNLSEVTVKIHRGQAMKKMAARSVADLVRKAEFLGVKPHSQKSS